MTFADKLKALREKATPGKYVVDDVNWELVAIDENPYRYIANFDPHVFSNSQITDKQIKANAKLYAHLVNHAEELEALVRAVENSVAFADSRYKADLVTALAALNKEKT